SSNYEYPGRYTRWDTAIVDPPVVISSHGRTMRVEALNRRGEAMLPSIAAAVEPLVDVKVTERGTRFFALSIAGPRQAITEEERSRLPSVFTVLRAITDLFHTEDDSNLGLYGAFGYDLAFQFDSVDLRLERPQSQRDLVLYL